MSRADIGSDLAKVDAHTIQPEEYEDAPELDDAFFERAVFRVGGLKVDEKVWRAAQGKDDRAKVTVDLHLDADVLEHFKGAGPHWETVVNAVLRTVMEEQAHSPVEPA